MAAPKRKPTGGIGTPATGRPAKVVKGFQPAKVGVQAVGQAIQRKRPPGPNTITPKGKGYGTTPIRRTTKVVEQNYRVPGGVELTDRSSKPRLTGKNVQSTGAAKGQPWADERPAGQRFSPTGTLLNPGAQRRPPTLDFIRMNHGDPTAPRMSSQGQSSRMQRPTGKPVAAAKPKATKPVARPAITPKPRAR